MWSLIQPSPGRDKGGMHWGRGSRGDGRTGHSEYELWEKKKDELKMTPRILGRTATWMVVSIIKSLSQAQKKEFQVCETVKCSNLDFVTLRYPSQAGLSSRPLYMGWVCPPLRRHVRDEHCVWVSGLADISQEKCKISRDSKR